MSSTQVNLTVDWVEDLKLSADVPDATFQASFPCYVWGEVHTSNIDLDAPYVQITPQHHEEVQVAYVWVYTQEKVDGHTLVINGESLGTLSPDNITAGPYLNMLGIPSDRIVDNGLSCYLVETDRAWAENIYNSVSG